VCLLSEFVCFRGLWRAGVSQDSICHTAQGLTGFVELFRGFVPKCSYVYLPKKVLDHIIYTRVKV